MQNTKELIEEANSLLSLAEKIQDETREQGERELALRELEDLYHKWYRVALHLFDEHNRLFQLELSNF